MAGFIEMTLRDGDKVKVVEDKILSVDQHTGGTSRVTMTNGKEYIVPIQYTNITDTKNLGAKV